MTEEFFYNRKIDKGELKRIIRWFVLQYGPSKTTLFLDKLKNLGFHAATLSGLSLGIEDLKTPPTKKIFIKNAEEKIQTTESFFCWGAITPSERFQRIIEVWTLTSEYLKDDVISYFEEIDPLNSLYVMAFSGARGNISQVRQLVGMRGLMSDPKGQIIDTPIQTNFREGLRVTEYMISCYGARKGLVDTALGTAHAGYLTRRLVDLAHSILISEINCYSSDGLFIQKPQPNQIIGRVCSETLVCLENFHSSLRLNNSVPPGVSGTVYHKAESQYSNVLYKNFILTQRNEDISPFLAQKICSFFKKDIVKVLKRKNLFSLSSSQFCQNGLFIRSPLTCESLQVDSVCQFCYGWNLAYRRLVPIGDAVGILAAQSIGEPGTQLTMRTFHTGGIFYGAVQQRVEAPHDGFIAYSKLCKGEKVRLLNGHPGFLTSQPVQVILYFIKNEKRIFQSKLFVPAQTVLCVFPGQRVFQKDIIAELLFVSVDFQLTKNEVEMGMSEKNDEIIQSPQECIQSPIDAQLCFGNLAFTYNKDEKYVPNLPKIIIRPSFLYLLQVNSFFSSIFAFLQKGDLFSSALVYHLSHSSYDFIKNQSDTVLRETNVTSFGVLATSYKSDFVLTLIKLIKCKEKRYFYSYQSYTVKDYYCQPFYRYLNFNKEITIYSSLCLKYDKFALRETNAALRFRSESNKSSLASFENYVHPLRRSVSLSEAKSNGVEQAKRSSKLVSPYNMGFYANRASRDNLNLSSKRSITIFCPFLLNNWINKSKSLVFRSLYLFNTDLLSIFIAAPADRRDKSRTSIGEPVSSFIPKSLRLVSDIRSPYTSSYEVLERSERGLIRSNLVSYFKKYELFQRKFLEKSLIIKNFERILSHFFYRQQKFGTKLYTDIPSYSDENRSILGERSQVIHNNKILKIERSYSSEAKNLYLNKIKYFFLFFEKNIQLKIPNSVGLINKEKQIPSSFYLKEETKFLEKEKLISWNFKPKFSFIEKENLSKQFIQLFYFSTNNFCLHFWKIQYKNYFHSSLRLNNYVQFSKNKQKFLEKKNSTYFISNIEEIYYTSSTLLCSDQSPLASLENYVPAGVRGSYIRDKSNTMKHVSKSKKEKRLHDFNFKYIPTSKSLTIIYKRGIKQDLTKVYNAILGHPIKLHKLKCSKVKNWTRVTSIAYNPLSIRFEYDQSHIFSNGVETCLSQQREVVQAKRNSRLVSPSKASRDKSLIPYPCLEYNPQTYIYKIPTGVWGSYQSHTVRRLVSATRASRDIREKSPLASLENYVPAPSDRKDKSQTLLRSEREVFDKRREREFRSKGSTYTKFAILDSNKNYLSSYYLKLKKKTNQNILNFDTSFFEKRITNNRLICILNNPSWFSYHLFTSLKKKKLNIIRYALRDLSLRSRTSYKSPTTVCDLSLRPEGAGTKFSSEGRGGRQSLLASLIEPPYYFALLRQISFLKVWNYIPQSLELNCITPYKRSLESVANWRAERSLGTTSFNIKNNAKSTLYPSKMILARSARMESLYTRWSSRKSEAKIVKDIAKYQFVFGASSYSNTFNSIFFYFDFCFSYFESLCLLVYPPQKKNFVFSRILTKKLIEQSYFPKPTKRSGEVQIPYSFPKFVKKNIFLQSEKVRKLVSKTNLENIPINILFDNYGNEKKPFPFIPFTSFLGAPIQSLNKIENSRFITSSVCDTNHKFFLHVKYLSNQNQIGNLIRFQSGGFIQVGQIIRKQVERSCITPDRSHTVRDKSSLESEASPYQFETCLCDQRSEVLERSEREQVRSSRAKREGIDRDSRIRLPEYKNAYFVLRTVQASLLPKESEITLIHGSPIFRNDILFSFSQQKSKTGDIVQGLPKINRLFEIQRLKQTPSERQVSDEYRDRISKRIAKLEFNSVFLRETTIPSLFGKDFYYHKKWSQICLLDQIQNVYNSQGVSIDDKHIEVILRQMTNHILILSMNDLGFFPGDTLDFFLFQKIAPFCKQHIFFTPLLIGITKLCLQSPSILSPASFQETKRSLVKSAIASRIDFLGGLKEHVMLGNIIPAGTGFQALSEQKRNSFFYKKNKGDLSFGAKQRGTEFFERSELKDLSLGAKRRGKDLYTYVPKNVGLIKDKSPNSMRPVFATRGSRYEILEQSERKLIRPSFTVPIYSDENRSILGESREDKVILDNSIRQIEIQMPARLRLFSSSFF
uniref:DNA-directed RNA polymerase n=1 Tax=Microrhizoidea pickettheapsiorum TaxID=2604950 RepID=A0A5B9RK60_9CHLO|nr:RNA polymerase b'-subunit [Microrhizoidea pickettheapsiorum]QEG77669.1 RNA polymerase b'-subunit [Microrhizoidea pickettheapsiorum]